MKPVFLNLKSKDGSFTFAKSEEFEAGKEIAVKSAYITNTYVPIFVGKTLQNTIDPSVFPVGSTIQIDSSVNGLDYQIYCRNRTTGLFKGGNITFDSRYNDLRAPTFVSKESLFNTYYYCYDIDAVINMFQTSMNAICQPLGSTNTFIINYNADANTFSLAVDEDFMTNNEIYLNDSFHALFPFSRYRKQPLPIEEKFNEIVFTNPLTLNFFNTNYYAVHCNITRAFSPFDSITVTTNLPISQSLRVNTISNVNTNSNEYIIFTFDKLNNSVNFYDFFTVVNENVQMFHKIQYSSGSDLITFNLNFTYDGQSLPVIIPDGNIFKLVLYVK